MSESVIVRELGQTFWDSSVPGTINSRWRSGCVDCPFCGTVYYRAISVFCVVIFIDLRIDATGNVIYMRSVTDESHIHVCFIKDKSKRAL